MTSSRPPKAERLRCKFKRGDVVRWNAIALYGCARDGWIVDGLEVKNSLLPIYRVRKGTFIGSAIQTELEYAP